MNGDTPSSRPRLVFDIPFRVVGYVSTPAEEVGVLLWSGIDPYRYFNQSDRSGAESFEHLITLDYEGAVVGWQSAQLDGSERRWLEVSPDLITQLNERIRAGEPLRYRQT